MPHISPLKYGKRVNIKKMSYRELLALKDPPSLKGSKSMNNLAYSYAQFQQIRDRIDPFSIFKSKRELSKSTAKLNEPKVNDNSDYTVTGNVGSKEHLFANGIGINPNNTLNAIRSDYLQSLQRHQENKREIFPSTSTPE